MMQMYQLGAFSLDRCLACQRPRSRAAARKKLLISGFLVGLCRIRFRPRSRSRMSEQSERIPHPAPPLEGESVPGGRQSAPRVQTAGARQLLNTAPSWVRTYCAKWPVRAATLAADSAEVTIVEGGSQRIGIHGDVMLGL